jgi:hypothetical protein
LFFYYSHYEGDTVNGNGVCILIPDCGERKPVTPSIYVAACGPDCVEIEAEQEQENEKIGSGVCGRQCHNLGQYINDTKNGITLGQCVFKEDCGDRQKVEGDASYPCGDGCVLQEKNEICDLGCDNPLHFEAINGKCVPTTPCERRGLDSESNSVCGEGCVQNERTSQCSGECDNGAHYEAHDSGVCEIKPCENRKVNISDGVVHVCGYGDCSAQVLISPGDGSACNTACPQTEFVYFYFSFIYIFFYFFHYSLFMLFNFFF